MAVTDLPEHVSDGQYSLTVTNVHRTWADEDSVAETVIAELRPESPSVQEGVRTPVDGDLFPSTPTEGARYQVTVADGEIDHLHRDWEGSVRETAPDVSDDLVLPLRRSEEYVPGTLETPSVATMDRNKSLLVTGEPGAGKTEAIKLLLNQIQADADTPMIVFSYKDDYTEWAEGRDDVVKLSTQGASHVYNIFEEIDPDGRGDAEFDEMARSLFAERRTNSKNVFFPDAAATLLDGLLKLIYRERTEQGYVPDNRDLLRTTSRHTVEELHDMLSAENDDGRPVYPDLQEAASVIDPMAPKQAAGVYSTMQLVLKRTFATSDFGLSAQDGETISIREYIEKPAGRILLLDFPIAEPERATPVFRMFLQRAIKFGLRDRGQAYYVLDEFARIPKIDIMENLVDTGRAQNAQAILGLQSIVQLDANYGELIGQALRSGMLYELHLRSGDPSTVSYVQHRLGGGRQVTNFVSTDSEVDLAGGTTSHTEGVALIQELQDGEGFFVTPRGRARVRLPMYQDLDPETRRALSAGTANRSRSAVVQNR